MTREFPASATAQDLSQPRYARQAKVGVHLESALLEAMAEIDRGECVDLTPDMLDRWERTGEFPWLWDRFDDEHVHLLVLRGEPPVPEE
jgi:hypothetical protein